MMHNGNRVIKLKKKALLKRILENKEKHIKEYKIAIVAYKEEAIKQLTESMKLVERGDLNVVLNLTTPINNSKNYDKIHEMFKWEISANVELTQNEFDEYVLDANHFAKQAFISNTMYLNN